MEIPNFNEDDTIEFFEEMNDDCEIISPMNINSCNSEENNNSQSSMSSYYSNDPRIEQLLSTLWEQAFSKIGNSDDKMDIKEEENNVPNPNQIIFKNELSMMKNNKNDLDILEKIENNNNNNHNLNSSNNNKFQIKSEYDNLFCQNNNKNNNFNNAQQQHSQNNNNTNTDINNIFYNNKNMNTNYISSTNWKIGNNEKPLFYDLLANKMDYRPINISENNNNNMLELPKQEKKKDNKISQKKEILETKKPAKKSNKRITKKELKQNSLNKVEELKKKHFELENEFFVLLSTNKILKIQLSEMWNLLQSNQKLFEEANKDPLLIPFEKFQKRSDVMC